MPPQRKTVNSKVAVDLELDTDLFIWLNQKAKEQGVTVEEYTASRLEEMVRSKEASVAQTVGHE